MFTARETACQIKVPSAGATISDVISVSIALLSSQRSKSSGSMVTGTRSWSTAMSGPAAAVTIATVSTSSPFGPLQVSATPAKATGRPSARWMKYGCLPPREVCHS